jgi:hypothetical protein
MPTPDEIATNLDHPIAAELLERMNAAYIAIEGWPRAFAEADVERIRLTLPAVSALSAFLAAHSSEAISIIGTVALELWSGSDFYEEAGRSFIAGDVAGARSKWASGNAAWAHASVAPT